MLLATYLKIAIFALATAPVGFARPRAPGSSRANTDLGARDEQFDIREFAINDIYGRDPADDYVSARELNEGVQDLELRQWAAIARIGLRMGLKAPSSNNNHNKKNG